jgi:hypothetical protein
LPPDEHPPCAATMALMRHGVISVQGHLLPEDDRPPLLLLRQLVAEPGGPWPAPHVDADSRWEQAVTWARALRWDDPDSWPHMDDAHTRRLMLSWLEGAQEDLLQKALCRSGLPDGPDVRARLRATLEGVPSRARRCAARAWPPRWPTASGRKMGRIATTAAPRRAWPAWTAGGSPPRCGGRRSACSSCMRPSSRAGSAGAAPRSLPSVPGRDAERWSPTSTWTPR